MMSCLEAVPAAWTRVVMSVAVAALLAPTGRSAAAQSAPASAGTDRRPGPSATRSATAPWITWPPPREECAPATGSAEALLARARLTLGLDSVDGTKVRQVTSRLITFHNYESDRPYRPFLTFVTDEMSLLDPKTGVQRDSTTFAFDGFGAQPPNATVEMTSSRSVVVRRDSGWVQSNGAWRAAESSRALDPWAVILAWSADGDAHVRERCRYRDYTRLVIERHGIFGPERLYLDPKTGFVVKLDRDEPQYLWGQQHVEYVYTSWLRFSGPAMPTTSARLVDGDEELVRQVVSAQWVRRDSVPRLTGLDSAAVATVTLPGFLRPAPIDTVRLGPRVFLLANRGYNEIVALVRDTVLVLEATQGEERARADSAWIGRLFPGHHPIVVVVTDLAWPHVSGVRFWVASGATIVSRDLSERFLHAVVDRRWTLTPDKLERDRHRVVWHFRPVRDSLHIGGLAVYPIDGIASEGALFAYLPGERLLWASDYVQDTTEPTLYAAEVVRAACRAGLTPTRGAAQHVPPFSWSTISQLADRMRVGAPSSPCLRGPAGGP
jgi:hypothetical protein